MKLWHVSERSPIVPSHRVRVVFCRLSTGDSVSERFPVHVSAAGGVNSRVHELDLMYDEFDLWSGEPTVNEQKIRHLIMTEVHQRLPFQGNIG